MVPQLVGRAAEITLIDAFLDTAGRHGDILVLTGPPGVGKSALLDVAAGTATRSGWTVLRASAVESETDLGLSVLNQLLLPLHERLDDLRPDLRNALAVALGRGHGPAVFRETLVTATLALLHALASDTAVLLVVDDLQWADRASAGILNAVAHRLDGARIGVLAAWRTGSGGFFDRGGLPRHEVPPLDERAAAHLVATRFPLLPTGTLRRLLAEAQGNPLALLELPALVDDISAVDNRVTAPHHHVSSRLQDAFAARVAAMPAPARRMLLMAALDGTGDLDVLLSAGDSPVTPFGPSDDDLVSVDAVGRRLVFRHPIVRSAVLATSTGAERQHAHRALAGALHEQPERRVRHLAAAATGPDEDVAADLEEAAQRALTQGDPAGAMSALLQAAELSPDPAVRVRRLGEVAYLGADLTGDLATASRALAEARHAATGQGLPLHAAVAAAFLLLNSDGDLQTAIRLVTDTITAQAPHRSGADPELAHAVYALFELNLSSVRPEHWQRFLGTVDMLRPPLPALLPMLVAINVDPPSAAVPVLPELMTAITALGRETEPGRIRLTFTAALLVDRMEHCRDIALRVIRQGRSGDAPASALPALLHLALHEFLTGRWAEAEALAEEGAELSARLGYRSVRWPFQTYRANLAAVRGDLDAVRELTDRIVSWAVPRGSNSLLLFSHYAQELAALGAGDFEEAYRHAVAITPAGQVAARPMLARWIVLDLVEAATRTGRHREAAAHVAAFQRARVAALSPRAALLTTAAAAVAATDEASALFERALAVPHARQWTFEYARVQLLYGEHLRRARAAVTARIHLGAALDTFERLGARPWAHRAGAELRATGMAARAGSSPAGSPARLTPQETEVVSLAAVGLTNGQIAQRLQLSRRTVGAHLYRAFAKLGVNSRAALGAALAARSDPAPASRSEPA